ncbi:hypothetical protein KIN20_019507 [Parelaphostrongylus tenuis]|uniref:Uncharacterized protein n=1 Tax=Parelaphostrongylus tenuis TaxID=148309 RepID=A0AAD5MLE0_PARTN|nr:hypothetical protein KIN20_019507 [Parelaphostrongylus tenuis]
MVNDGMRLERRPSGETPCCLKTFNLRPQNTSLAKTPVIRLVLTKKDVFNKGLKQGGITKKANVLIPPDHRYCAD